MADLDDFFAKKDRKKAKGKKFLTTEEIAKKLETKRAETVKAQEQVTNPVEEQIPQIPEEEEEEWLVPEEEKKDYTGLKLGNLRVSEHFTGENDDDRGSGENCSDNEAGDNGSKQIGPWKIQDTATGEVVVPTPAPAAPPTSSVSSAGVYKSPHLRNLTPGAQRERNAPQMRSRQKNIAPDIRSEEYFPTLNAKQPQTAEPSGPWGRRKKDEGTFEEVRNRGGTRSYGDSQTEAPKLSLDNKYDALSQDQS